MVLVYTTTMADRSQLFSDIDSLEPERFTAHLASVLGDFRRVLL